jgi:hypothetical protein
MASMYEGEVRGHMGHNDTPSWEARPVYIGDIFTKCAFIVRIESLLPLNVPRIQLSTTTTANIILCLTVQAACQVASSQ